MPFVDQVGVSVDGTVISNVQQSFTLRCRSLATQSFQFTFLDHDGAIGHAAAIAPLLPASSSHLKVLSTNSGERCESRSLLSRVHDMVV